MLVNNTLVNSADNSVTDAPTNASTNAVAAGGVVDACSASTEAVTEPDRGTVEAADDEVTALLKALSEETASAVRLPRHLVSLTQISVVMLALCCCYPWSFGAITSMPIFDSILLTAVLALAPGVICYYVALRSSAKRRLDLLRKLASTNDFRIAGPMVETLASSRVKEVRIAVSLLKIMLPNLRSGDADQLSACHRTILNSILNGAAKGQDLAELRPAILHAYKHVGSAIAFSIVADLARLDYYTPDVVRIAAIECRVGMKARLGPILERHELLRAASSNKNEPMSLVRPAPTTSDNDSEELLRGS